MKRKVTFTAEFIVEAETEDDLDYQQQETLDYLEESFGIENYNVEETEL